MGSNKRFSRLIYSVISCTVISYNNHLYSCDNDTNFLLVMQDMRFVCKNCISLYQLYSIIIIINIHPVILEGQECNLNMFRKNITLRYLILLTECFSTIGGYRILKRGGGGEGVQVTVFSLYEEW